MKRVDVQAYADASQPDLGHTVILLAGVEQLAGVPVFRLRPLDLTEDETNQWPEGDHNALATRKHHDGIELIIGPEIAESPALLPGTAVEIELPEARIKGEFLWPMVTPAARPKRRNILAKRTPRDGREASPAALFVPDPLPSPPANTPNTVSPAPAVRAAATTVAPMAAAARTLVRPPLSSASAHPQPSALSERAPVAVRDLSAPPAFAPPILAPNVMAPHFAKSAAPAVAPKIEVTLAASAAASAVTPHMREQNGAPSMSQPIITEIAPGTPALAAAAGRETATQPNDPNFVTWYPHARGGRIGGPEIAPRSQAKSAFQLALPTSRGGIIGLVLASVLAVEGALFMLRHNSAATAAPEPAAAARANEALAAAAIPETRLFEALEAGAVSPRGANGKDGNADKLLELASASLFGDGAERDTDEGAYWLRRYLATKVGDERTLRAITQLGSVYAERRTPDYVKARQMWEMASAFGDPVAMCFLGTLNEHGLGSAPDRRMALQWFQRAKTSGGCPAVDEAITRLR